ncbi:hypothetical protein [Collimonas sp.]|jgi:hypothetical protein|uniref:hypothetical protein n=1 Tax=Collimonas sp. TaxID=1963772 RepID=UPI0037BF5650
MKRRDFIRHLGLGASGALLIPVGLSGCVVAPAARQQARAKTPPPAAMISSASSADSRLSVGAD